MHKCGCGCSPRAGAGGRDEEWLSEFACFEELRPFSYSPKNLSCAVNFLDDTALYPTTGTHTTISHIYCFNITKFTTIVSHQQGLESLFK